MNAPLPRPVSEARSLEPNLKAIRDHLEWLTAPARGAYDDALIEIAYDHNGDQNPSRTKLFELDQLDDAVQFAARQNASGCNVYVGAALRLPSSPRNKRCSAGDFYVATAVPADIDQDYDAVRVRMAKACDDALVVATGLTPQRRSQHWVRLAELCDEIDEFAAGFAGLVLHIGADAKAKDGARVMRLGGTVSYPTRKKTEAGYIAELTTVQINSAARPISVEYLARLEPGPAPAGAERQAGQAWPDFDGTEEIKYDAFASSMAEKRTGETLFSGVSGPPRNGTGPTRPKTSCLTKPTRCSQTRRRSTTWTSVGRANSGSGIYGGALRTRWAGFMPVSLPRFAFPRLGVAGRSRIRIGKAQRTSIRKNRFHSSTPYPRRNPTRLKS
jgi:hypothetical protein